MSLRIRRGTEAERTTHIFDQGEIVYTTDEGKLFIGDGQTAGGVHALKTSVGVGFEFNDLTQRIDFSVPALDLSTADVAEDASRLYYTDTRALDAVGAALVAGPNSGIAFVYNHDLGTITATVTEGIDALLPPQVGQQGKWLTTDGETVSWATAPLGGLSFPSPTGHQSQFLTTADGATLSWATPTTANLVNGAYAVMLGANGKTTFQGDILLSTSVDVKRDVGGGVYASVLGGLNAVSGDASPALGGDLTLTGHNIIGTGNVNITGSITSSGAVTAGSVTSNGAIASHAINATGDIFTTADITADGTIGGLSLSATTSINGASLSVSGAIDGNSFATDSLSIAGSTITSTGTVPVTTERADAAVVLGTNADPATMWANSSKNFAYLTGLTDGTNNSGITSRISRGSLASKQTVQAGDMLAYIEAQGWLNTEYVIAGMIGIGVDSGQPNPSVSGVMPGQFGAMVVNSTGNGVHLLTLNSLGVLNAPIIKPTAYESGSLPTDPEEGWMVFDTTTKQFKGWNGTTWVVLG